MSTRNVTDATLLEWSVCWRQSSPLSLSLLRSQQLSAAGVAGSLAASWARKEKRKRKPAGRRKTDKIPNFHVFPQIFNASHRGLGEHRTSTHSM